MALRLRLHSTQPVPITQLTISAHALLLGTCTATFRHSHLTDRSSGTSQQRLVVFIIDMCISNSGPAISSTSLWCIVTADKKASGRAIYLDPVVSGERKVFSFSSEYCAPNVFIRFFGYKVHS
jgi:hypothetical protein